MKQEEVPQNNACPSDQSNPCPICLGSILEESYLDQCLHKFCYNCIIHWIKVVGSKQSRKLSSVKCPLCKIENISVVHGFDGGSFQRYYINQELDSSFILSKAHKYRLQCYYTEPGFLSDIFDVARYWKLQKYRQPNQWLENWLKREIESLLQEEDVDIIVHHILGIINTCLRRNEQQSRTKTPEAKEEEFKSLVCDAARPFLASRTDQFVNEVELFLASSLNIEAYDAVCKQRLGWSAPGIINETEALEGQPSQPVRPYLYIFDEDSDETD